VRDLAREATGVLAILVAIAHDIIIELQVFAKARIEPQRMRNVLRGVSQASTVDWIGMGGLLIAALAFGSQLARGRHPGSWLMCVAVALALMGL
jgi:hypothetical protein